MVKSPLNQILRLWVNRAKLPWIGSDKLHGVRLR